MEENLEYPFQLLYGDLRQEEPAEWTKVLHYLDKYATGHTGRVYIPVTGDSFDNSVAIQYGKQVHDFIQRGHIRADAEYVDNVVKLAYCIEEGDHGDEDGFGVEPDTWIFAILDLNGKFIQRFGFEENYEYR